MYGARHSHLYVFLRKASYPLLYQLGLLVPRYRRNVEIYLFATDLYEGTQDYVRAFARLSDKTGRSVFFLIIPDKIQVYDELWNKSLKAAAIDDAEVDLFTPNKMLAEILRVSGVRYVDVLPFMRQKRDNSFYFYYDGHWARGGHDFAAKQVHHFLSGMLESAQGRGQKTCRFR